ncbi:MAG: alpha/beta fold hydrolase [Deltaproteobacteria bacterium]|nr:alpha/beta fold hydrolase [Deltaproteobacteria bacterium]
MDRDDARDKPPAETPAELWTEGAERMAEAFRQLAATFAAPPAAAGTTVPGTAAARAWGEQLAASFASLGRLQGEFAGRLLENLPAAARERLGVGAFSQLERLARTRWEDEAARFGRLPELLAERAERTGPVDPERLARLMQTAAAELKADLEALSPEQFVPDLGRLAQSFGRVLSGAPAADDRRRVDRFLEAAAVKLRYGSEYYADPTATKVGPTPRDLVHREGRIELYRYRSASRPTPKSARPVLLVYSVINKPYILDLLPGFSFVEHLLDQGLDPYLIEWGPVVPGDRETTLDSYIDPGIHGCVEHIRRTRKVARVPLFGHCIGGNLALLYAAQHPETVDRLVTLTTPVTAADGGVVALWTDRDLFPVDAIVDACGHMPAKLIRYTFMAIKPYYELLKWKMFIDGLADDRTMGLFLPIDRWANENVDIPGEVFRKFIDEVFHSDRFRHGRTKIHGWPADPRAITCPLLNLAATRDWIVPLESARVLNDLVGSAEKEFVPIEGAHVGIMIDPRARPLWTKMSDFLRQTPPARKPPPRKRAAPPKRAAAPKRTAPPKRAPAKARPSGRSGRSS